MNVVPFEKESIQQYLDDCIFHWRTKRQTMLTEEEKLIVSCYTDAFQSVRISLFGSILPEGDDEIH